MLTDNNCKYNILYIFIITKFIHINTTKICNKEIFQLDLVNK